MHSATLKYIQRSAIHRYINLFSRRGVNVLSGLSSGCDIIAQYREFLLAFLAPLRSAIIFKFSKGIPTPLIYPFVIVCLVFL